ncbi:MAG: glycosyltransferase [Clostridia bacterium]|nr:glycosyltransferase [Clostridia bacterium]
MSNIKISVIIPVYNTATFLPKCLDSLHSQKYEDVEYILVNDGSTDNSLHVCEVYAQKDERFVVISKENGGPSSARNLAISKARGEYITFVDSDDYIEENAYETIADLLEKHEDPDMLVFGAELTPFGAPDYMYRMTNTRDIVYEKFEPAILFDEVGARPFLWLQVIRRSLIVDHNIKMDESIRLGEDQVFQMEVIPFAQKVVFTSHKLYYYRWRRVGSIMSETSEKKIMKLRLHVDLVDKVFNVMEKWDRDDEMKKKTLIWSIFFLWGDILYLMEDEQNDIALALVKVWEKHSYQKYTEDFDIWCQVRLNHILLMAEPDRDKRIELFTAANADLKKKIDEIYQTEEYKEILASRVPKLTFWQRAKRCLKVNGIFGTIKKILKKTYQKLFK